MEVTIQGMMGSVNIKGLWTLKLFTVVGRVTLYNNCMNNFNAGQYAIRAIRGRGVFWPGSVS